MRRVLLRLPPRTGASPYGGSDSAYMVEDTVSKELANKLRLQFYDVGQKKCTLCEEFYAVSSYQGHTCYAWHQARVGIIERLIAGSASSAVQAPRRWWDSISKNPTCHFNRLPSLSHDTQSGRLQRIFHLLVFLVQRGVIRESLTIFQRNIIQKSVEFEKFEMVGDNVIKFVFADRLTLLFPASEGGLTSRLHLIQQLIDSNDGLLRIYDYLHLDWIIGCKLPNSKTKSDVIESLFGELQTWLWADEIRWGMEYYDYLPCPEHRSLRLLVGHVLNELTHLLVMFAVLTTHDRSIEFVLKNLRQSSRSLRSGAAAVGEPAVVRPKYAHLPLLEERRGQPVGGGSDVLVSKVAYALQKVPRKHSLLHASRMRVTGRFVDDLGRYQAKIAELRSATKGLVAVDKQRSLLEHSAAEMYVAVDWAAKIDKFATATFVQPSVGLVPRVESQRTTKVVCSGDTANLLSRLEYMISTTPDRAALVEP